MKKKNVPVFALLKTFSWLSDLMVMQGDFTVKKIQNWEENQIKNWFIRNKMWWVVDIHNHMCQIGAKGFRFELYLGIYWKISNFDKIITNLTYSQKIVILKV